MKARTFRSRAFYVDALGFVEAERAQDALYLRDLDVHRVELFTGDDPTVDPDFEPIRWTIEDPRRQTLWGQPAPTSWFEEGTPFERVTVDEPRLTARPIHARQPAPRSLPRRMSRLPPVSGRLPPSHGGRT